MNIKNINLKNKILIIIFAPIAMLTYFIVQQIKMDVKTMQKANHLEEVLNLSIKVSDLVHEIQKERGLGAGYIGSNGQKFEDKLTQQRIETNKKLQELLNSHLNANYTNDEIVMSNLISDAFRKLERINEVRGNVTKLSWSLHQNLDYYSEVNHTLLQAITENTKVGFNHKINTMLFAYVFFMEQKEKTGIERAVLTNTFASAKFTKGIYRKLIELVDQQAEYKELFLTFASDEQIEFFNQQMNTEPVIEAERYRQKAFELAENKGIEADAALCFSYFTKKINIQHKIENKIADDIEEASRRIVDGARQDLVKAILIFTFLIVVVTGLMTYVLRATISPLKKAQQFIQSIAQGDLTSTIEIDQKDEVGIIISNIKEMRNKLKQIISEITTIANQNTNASRQLSDSAQELSENSNEQASSVEEIASTMEEITSNINNTTDNARSMERLSISVGGDIEQMASGILETIEANKIIQTKTAVISEFSFQTNILALNAAVEAARSGANGKGFAVVAAEVRKLAESSKIAAEEIKKEVESALQKVEDAGVRISTIIPLAQQTLKLVKEVAIANEEQNTGIEQINASMQLLGGSTQQNAAASEELAASSEELFSQAEALKELVSFFNTEDSSYQNKSIAEMKPTTQSIKTLVSDEAHVFGKSFLLEEAADVNEYQSF